MLAALVYGAACDPTEVIADLAGVDTSAPLSDTALDTAPAPHDTTASVACSRDEDCAAVAGCCYTGACSSGVCVARPKLDCCSVEGPCAVSSPLHTATCEQPCAASGCVKSLRLGDARCDEVLWRLALDDEGLAALSTMDARSDDRVGWHLSPRRPFGGAPSLHAGDALCPTYHAGPLDASCAPVAPEADTDAISLSLLTPTVTLPADVPALATLWVWLEVEPAPADGASGYDGVELSAVDSGGVVRRLWSSRQTPAPSGVWTPLLIDLSPLAGLDVGLRLAFDTVDGRANDFEGFYLGALAITTVCADRRGCPEPTPCALGRLVDVAGVRDRLCVVAPNDPARACAPCDAASDCETTDPCDVARCDAGACTVARTLTAECCTPRARWPGPPSFEEPLDDSWTITSDPEDGGAWARTTVDARTGGWALRFGDPDGPRLSPEGLRASGEIWSPSLTVPADAPALSFALRLSTEWDGAPDGDNPAGVDLLEALVAVDLPAGVSLPPAVVWDSRAIGGTTDGAWIDVTVPLDAFLGQRVRIGWRFDTVDGASNGGAGAFIDDASVFRRCPAPDPPPAPRTGRPL
ncbi:MAG: hypothetical protein CSA66_03670 [Proteobacteria bacterium]|nr:MAG: hypothetical protein CSA66_03670 [Pseudomonadota bacterium]